MTAHERPHRDGPRAQTRADLQPRQLRPRPSAPLPDDRAFAGRAIQAPVGADPLGLADHRQLRLPRAGRLRARPRRHQAAQRRVHLAQPAYRHRARRWRCARSIIRHTAEIFEPDLFIVDKEPLGLRGEVRTTLRAAEGARHAAGARPARRDGRAASCSSRMGAQEGVPGAGASSTTRSGSMACRRSAIRCAGIDAAGQRAPAR